MPIPLLAALCVMVLFLPFLLGLVPALIIENDAVRLVVASIGYTIALGSIVALHVYGHSVHPSWWGEDGPMTVVLIPGTIATCAVGIFALRQIFD